MVQGYVQNELSTETVELRLSLHRKVDATYLKSFRVKRVYTFRDTDWETPDISQYLDFGWYDWVWYKENSVLDMFRLGRFLGITDFSRNLMEYHILPKSCIPITSGTVQRVKLLEKITKSTKERMSKFS